MSYSISGPCPIRNTEFSYTSSQDSCVTGSDATTTAFAYRALLLAGAGDVVVLDVARVPAFEDYFSDTLGLGPVELLAPECKAISRSISILSAV